MPDFTPLLPGTVPVASLCTESSRLCSGADWAGKNILFNFQMSSENDDYDDLESQVAVTAFTGGILSIVDLVGDEDTSFSAPRLRKVSRRLSCPLRR